MSKMINHTYNNIEASRREYEALPTEEWRKDYFNEENGGFVAIHVLKTKDDLAIPGIAAEANACQQLATMGKHVLRLPENIPNLIDDITIDDNVYHKLLKFKHGENKPRGYPDAYFDKQTWDFKTSTFKNDDSIRQAIKNGRKADNLVFIVHTTKNIGKIRRALEREVGKRIADGSWIELPDIYCLLGNQLTAVWKKE